MSGPRSGGEGDPQAAGRDTRAGAGDPQAPRCDPPGGEEDARAPQSDLPPGGDDGRASLTADDAATFERCMRVGGVAVFPADTVYGLACEPDLPEAVRRLYALKGRRPDKPAAVMFFDPELAFAALPELGTRTRALLARLLPGGVTALLPNPARRFPLACGPGPDTLGVRVPALPPAIAALVAVRWPVLQSSANAAGAADARRLDDVPAAIRREADLVLDGGELPGTPSTVVDLRRYEAAGEWIVVREGAVPAAAIAHAAG